MVQTTAKRCLGITILALLLTVLLIFPVFAAYPQPVDYISDESGVLSTTTKDALVTANEKLYATRNARIGICIVDSVGDEDIASYARNVFTDWNMSDGVLLVIDRGSKNYFAVQSVDIDKIVTDEVLKRTLDDPDYMIKLLQNMKEDREARMRAERDVRSAKIVVEAQQAIIEENKPKVAFFDVYSRCKGSILVGEMAKMLVQAGVKTVTVLGEVKKMGQNNLFAWLRENHYLGIRGDYYNKPTQRATELNIFEIKNTVRTDYYGNVIPCPVVKINAKGQQYFFEKFLGMKFSPTPNPLSLIGIRG